MEVGGLHEQRWWTLTKDLNTVNGSFLSIVITS